jgi:NitT/TauT family transport system ATP-binding protein
MNTPKVIIEDLTVQFPASSTSGMVTALQNFSLSVQPGEFACVVGPSGCGKTTVLRVLAELEDTTTGIHTINSQDANRPDHALVFQNAGLFPWMSVLENVAYGMRMQRAFNLPDVFNAPGSFLIQRLPTLLTRGRERYALAQEWINQVGLARFTDAFPHQLSGGMQQRVGLARAFAHNPEVMLLDEPFGALDAQTRTILQETLLELWKNSDMTVLFVTHSIEEALLLADRIVVMSARPGHIIAEFPVNFARPRDVTALRASPEFGQRYTEIWEVLRTQVDLAQQEFATA